MFLECFIFPDHHRDPHWGSGDGGDRAEDASILPFRKHGQSHQSHRNDWWKGQDKRVGVHLPVTRLIYSLLAGVWNCLKHWEMLLLQVFAVRRERRPSVSFRVSGSRHHERKEGADEGVVSVQEAHSRTRHSKSLKHYECSEREQRTWGKVAMVCPPVCCF